MYEVIWLPEALSDLESHFDYLNERNPEAASKAMRAILSSGSSLAKFPSRGTLIADTDQRKLRVFFGKSGYLLYYQIHGQQVVILRVHHGRSDRPR